jgi:peptidyl-prolyl cis-trans isomerase D
MLDQMRSMSKGIVSKMLLGFLVITFAVWGVGDILTSRGPNYAAKVGDGVITLGEFQQQRQLMQRQLESLGMRNLPAGQIEFAVLRQLVERKLTLLAMEDVGLFVGEPLLASHIRQMKEFQTKDGTFDAEKFQSIVKQQGLPERVFLAQLKRDIAGQFMTDSLDMGDAAVPEAVLALEAAVQGETRDVVLLTVPARDAMDADNTAAIEAYYETHKATDFVNPESRTLQYVLLTEADIDALVDAAITSDMIADRIKTNPEMNEGLARMKLRDEKRDAILLELSNTIEDQLAAGKKMAEAVSGAGIRASVQRLSGVTAGQVAKDDVLKAVIEQGFMLSEGEISRLISAGKGTRLMVGVESITAAAPKPLAEVKGEVRARLAKKLARDAAQAKAITVKDALAKADQWQAVSAEYSLSSRVLSRLGRPSPETREDAGLPIALHQAVFERKVGEVAGPLALDNGDQVLALITARHAPSATATPASKAAREALISQLSEQLPLRALDAFTRAHPVEVNPALSKSQASE